MILKAWEELPKEMRTEEVRVYYNLLQRKKKDLIMKRIFDVFIAGIMLIILSPVFLILAFLIKMDSEGPVFYRQIRITQYNKEFRIFKFRSMIQNADMGSHVTLNDDHRITKIGRFIRKYRLDELSQLIDVFRGTMTFVGTRPEVPKYTKQYNSEMMATLLLPAGVTSLASIKYKDEAKLLDSSKDTDKIYVEKILPQKMKYNLQALEKFGFWEDIKIMFMTVFEILRER